MPLPFNDFNRISAFKVFIHVWPCIVTSFQSTDMPHMIVVLIFFFSQIYGTQIESIRRFFFFHTSQFTLHFSSLTRKNILIHKNLVHIIFVSFFSHENRVDAHKYFNLILCSQLFVMKIEFILFRFSWFCFCFFVVFVVAFVFFQTNKSCARKLCKWENNMWRLYFG